MNEKLVKELENQIILKDFKLNSLLEITNAINSNQPVDQLSRIFEFILKEQLGFDKFILFNKQDDWNCMLKVGFRGKIKDIDVVRDLFRFKDITVIESSPSIILNEFDIVVPILHKEVPLAYLLIAGLEHQKLKVSETMSNMSFIQTLVNIIVVAIENKRMAKATIKKERLKK